MKKSVLFILLALLTTLTLTASAAVSFPAGLTNIDAEAFAGDTSLKGRIVLPAAVQTVGSRAFADTSLHSLVLPAGCKEVDGSALSGTQAAYLQLNGGSTRITGSLSGAAYVFGPAFGSASSLSNFYANETLVSQDGFYYSVTDGTAIPLCAVDDTSVSGVLTLPKLVNGQPVHSLDTLILHGLDNMTALRIPAYLDIPAHLNASTYTTMTVSTPCPSAVSGNVGSSITWSTEVTGAYGEVTYLWTFETGDTMETRITTQPTVDYTLKTAGSCHVKVSATDAVGDSASAVSEEFRVNDAEPVYRALLVCNTYAGTPNALPGTSNDVAGMRSMLSKMTGTPYRITTQSNLSADAMASAIRSAFANATANDVSLFYFSGHGTNAVGTSYHGALLGAGGSYMTIAKLKAVLDEIPGKKVIIVDTCHSGQLIGKSGTEASFVTREELIAFNSKVVGAFSVIARGENDLANSSYYVITAAHSTEDSVSMGYDANKDGVLDKYFGLFTYSLCYGSGWNMATNVTRSLSADVDGDGEITLFEAYAYARSKAQQSNPNQTAQVYPDNSTLVIWGK